MKKQSVIMLFLSISTAITAHASVPQNMAQFPEGERLVYTRLVEAYRHGKLAEVTKERQTLERNYPRSIHLDNAYYLTGMLELQNGHMGEALKSFGVVRDKFVKSHKRPSAMFASAVTYQRLNLIPQSHRLLERVIAEYPGSQESQRAWMQLRLEKEAPKKR